MGGLGQGTKALLQAPAFSAAFVLTMALGVGVNSAMFSVSYGVLARPLQNEHGGRLVFLRQSAEGLGFENMRFSVPELADYRTTARSVEAIGEFSAISFTLLGLGDPRQVRAGVVDGHFFHVVGLRPVLGRLLGPADDGPTAHGAVVLTHRFWADLGADPDVIGRAIQLGARTATVVGVLEPAPAYPEDTEIITNVVVSPHHLSATMVTDRQHRMTDAFAVLVPGASADDAQVEFDALLRSQMQAHPSAYEAEGRYAVHVVPLKRQMAGRAREALLLLFGTSVLVLLVACANLANLLLARLLSRRANLAIRASLGATTRSLRLELLREVMLLAVAGAALASLAAVPMARIVSRFAARFTVRAADMPLDPIMFWFGLAVSLAAAITIAALVPLPTGISSGDRARGASLSAGGRRLQRLLAVSQVALSAILVAGAALFAQALIALERERTGLDADAVLALDVPLVPTRDKAAHQRLYLELERELTNLAGVESVAIGTMVPLREDGGFFNNLEFRAEGSSDEPGRRPRGNFRSVSPGYLATLGIPLLAGRGFDAGDVIGAPEVVMVSRSVAELLFPGRDAVGRFLSWTDPRMKFGGVSTGPRRIVGVVNDVRERALDLPPEPTIYHPFAQEPLGGRVFVRTRQDPHLLERQVTQVIRSLAAEQPIATVGMLSEIRAQTLEPSRVAAALMTGLAGIALAIAAVGIFGVQSYSVGTRLREFGIRLAIGSTRARVVIGVLREAAGVGAAGLAIGLVGAAGVGRLLRSSLYGVEAATPWPFLAASAALFTAVALAAALPAWRACRVDPIWALRDE